MKLTEVAVPLYAVLLVLSLLEAISIGQVEAPISSDAFPNIETVPSTPYPFMLLSIDNEAKLLVSTSRSTVYTYDETSFTKIFDIPNAGNREVYGLFQDEQGNIYISPAHNGTVWRSSDGGQTWTRPLNMVAQGGETGWTAPKPNWYSFGNGTILAGQWAYMGPYIYRSDNWGSTWFLWKNFTSIFPQYAIEDPLNKPAYWIRHIHGLFYLPSENALFVSLGDLMHTLYKSSDGGNTWTLAYPHGFTSHITLADRVLLGTDGDESIMLYQSQNFEPVWTPKGKNSSFTSTNIFRSFVFDEANDVLYVGVGTYPAAANKAYYTAILASLDKGETWTPIITLDTSPTTNQEAPDLALYGGHIYYSWNGMLKRFNRLSQAEVSYLHNQDLTTKIVVDKTHMSSATRVLKNPRVTIDRASLTNLLTNPSFETWGTTPMGWSEPWGSWNGSRAFGNGTGYHGSYSYKLALGGYGTTIVSTSSSLQLTRGFYTLIAHVKTNASYPRASVYIMTSQSYVSTSGYRMTEYVVDNWRKIQSQFYLETDKALGIWLRIDVPSGYVINATVEWDATILFKHPFFYGSNAPFSTENFNIPYTTTSVSTTNGSLIVGNQTLTFTTGELPKTVELGGYWIGNIPLRLLSGNIVNLTVSGDQILGVGNATLERRGTGAVYIGKKYNGFNVLNNIENASLAFYVSPFSITSAVLDSKVSTLNIDAAAGTTSTTQFYAGDKGPPTAVYASNGAVTWNYNSSTTMLNLEVVHLGPAEIRIDWRMPGDVNADEAVNVTDLFYLGRAYHSDSSESNWNTLCDFNGDGKVDGADLAKLNENYGKTNPG
jgi:hypothetical protein